MTHVGVAILEAVRPEREPFLRAFDAWVERARAVPALTPLWSRRSQSPDGNHWHVDPTLLAALRERGTEPCLYVESARPPTAPPSDGITFADLLTGEHDDQVRLLGCKADGHAVRLWQEPDADPRVIPWAGDPLYAEAWAHAANLLHAEGDIRTWWTPIQPLAAVKAGYYPGDAAVDILGFDRYSWTEDSSFPHTQWAPPVKQLRKLADKPIWVGECGRLAGLSRRDVWLQQAAAVPGPERVVVMDMKVPSHPHDWSWTPGMLDVFGGLA